MRVNKLKEQETESSEKKKMIERLDVALRDVEMRLLAVVK